MELKLWLTPHEKEQIKERERYMERTDRRRKVAVALSLMLGLLQLVLLITCYSQHWALFTSCALTLAMVIGIPLFFARENRYGTKESDEYRWIVAAIIMLAALYFNWGTFEEAWITFYRTEEEMASEALHNQIRELLRERYANLEWGITAFNQGYAVVLSTFLAFMVWRMYPPVGSKPIWEQAKARRQRMRSQRQRVLSGRRARAERGVQRR